MSHGTGLTTALQVNSIASTAAFNQCYFDWLQAVTRTGTNVMALPFDMAREQYAKSVQAGLLERSIVQSAQVSRTLGALEQLTLGPFARH